MAVVKDCHTRVEEQGVKALDKPFLLPGSTNFDQSIRGGAGRKAGQQSGAREGKGILQRYRVVDDCCGAGYVYEFDAFVPSVQVGPAVPEPPHDVSAFEIFEQYDLLQSECAG